MKSRLDSIIAASVIAGIIALGLTGVHALNDTSGVPSLADGPGSPIASPIAVETLIPEETAQPTIYVEALPGTGAGPSVNVDRQSNHTGWHATQYYRCTNWGSLQQMYAYMAATSSGGHTATTYYQQWFNVGWCW